MANLDEDIAKKIEDGSYYKDARQWYSQRYLQVFSERSFLLLMFIALFMILALSILNINAIRGVPRVIAFPVKVDNSTDYFSIMKTLAKTSPTTQEAVVKYLIIDYLKMREEYSHKELTEEKVKAILKRVKSSSSKNVLNEYKNYVSSTNPYSPSIRYSDRIERTINVKKIDFLNDALISGRAKIIFESEEKTLKTKEVKRALWESTIHFSIPDIETISKTGAPLRFIVKYYRIKPINNS